MEVIGFINPTCAFPSALCAVVRTDTGYASIYPDGTPVVTTEDVVQQNIREGYIIPLLNSPRIELGEDEYLYGISESHILIGSDAEIQRQLSLFLAAWRGPACVALTVAEHLASETPTSEADALVDFWRAKNEAELHQLEQSTENVIVFPE